MNRIGESLAVIIEEEDMEKLHEVLYSPIFMVAAQMEIKPGSLMLLMWCILTQSLAKANNPPPIKQELYEFMKDILSENFEDSTVE